MKALVYSGDLELTWCDWPEPELGPGEALLAVKAVGICGSDMHGYTGESGRRTPPIVMGHEAVGEVIRLGAGVSSEWLGQRVVINPIIYCGGCEQCKAGHTNQCLNRRFIGGDVDGAMAERIAVPIKNLVPLHQGVTYELGVLTEPLAVGLRAINRAGDIGGKSVLVIGCGPIGLLTIIAAKRSGTKLVIATDIAEKSRKLAEQLGADATLDPNVDNLAQSIEKISGPSGIDVALDAVGVQTTFDQAINLVRRGGMIVAIGGWQTLAIDFSMLVTRELTLLGTFNYMEEFKLALDLLVGDSLGLDRIVTHSFPLSRGAEVFALLEKDKGEFVKVVLTV